VTGDRWLLRDGSTLRGLTLTVTRFGVKPGAQPTPRDKLEGFTVPNSRWLTVEAMRSRAHARVADGVLLSAEDIPGGVRTRQHYKAQLGEPAFDLIQEERVS
jgi:hypothetical protein